MISIDTQHSHNIIELLHQHRFNTSMEIIIDVEMDKHECTNGGAVVPSVLVETIISEIQQDVNAISRNHPEYITYVYKYHGISTNIRGAKQAYYYSKKVISHNLNIN